MYINVTIEDLYCLPGELRSLTGLVSELVLHEVGRILRYIYTIYLHRYIYTIYIDIST